MVETIEESIVCGDPKGSPIGRRKRGTLLTSSKAWERLRRPSSRSAPTILGEPARVFEEPFVRVGRGIR